MASDLRPGAGVVLAPLMAGKTFDPAIYTIPSVSQDASGLDFRVPKPRYTISGSVTRSGQPQGGVRIGSTITAPDGTYSFTVEEGEDLTLAPVFQSYAFLPMERSLSAVSQDMPDQNFAMLSSPASVELSPLSHDFGSTEEGYSPIGAVTITVSNTGTDPYSGLSVSLSENSAFELGELSGAVLGGEASVSFSVRPKDALPAGSYSDTVILRGDSLLKYVTVTFQVEEAEAPPDTPEPPDTPNPPDTPEPPDTPDTPDTPNTPGTPDRPSTPSSSSGDDSSSDPAPDKTPAPAPVPLHTPYFIGFHDGTFRPDGSLTRGECAAVLARLSPDFDPEKDYSVYSLSSFSDVTEGQWYTSFIGYAVSSGLVSGYPDGTFHPDAPITRGEFSVLIRNRLKLETSDEAAFPDVTDHWARNAIGQLSARGILNGYLDGAFRPDASITRAEAVKVFNYTFDRVPESDLLRSLPPLPFSDLSDTHWAYFNIYEATFQHDASQLHK